MSDYNTSVGVTLYDDFDALVKQLAKLKRDLKSIKKEIAEIQNSSKNLSSSIPSQKSGKDNESSNKRLKETSTRIKEIDKESKKANKSLTSMFSVGKIYFFYNYLKVFGRGFANILKSAIDFTEIDNFYKSAMKDMYKTGMDFQEQLSEMYGLAMPNMMQAQATYKNMLGSLGGIAEETAYDISKTITKMTLDFSSLFNVDFDDAVTKFEAALSKQVRPIRSTSGMDITQNVLGATAQELGIERSVSQMNELEKRLLIVLTLADQMKRSGAMNDFAETIENPANQLRILKDQLKEVGRWIGAVFYQTIAKVLPYINGFVMFVKEMIKSLALLMGYTFESTDKTNILDQVSDGVEDTNDSLDASIKKAKEWKNVLMGFDVANVMPEKTDNDTSNGSKVGITVDEKILKALKEYNYIFDEIDMNANKVKKTIKEWWNQPLETKLKKFNEMLENIDFKKFGADLAEYPNKIIDAFENFDWVKFGQNMTRTFKNLTVSIWNFLTGFFTNLDWESYAKGIFNAIIGVFQRIPIEIKGMFEAASARKDFVIEVAAKLITTALELWKQFVDGIDKWRIGIENTLINKASDLFEKFKTEWGERKVAIINALGNTALKLWQLFNSEWGERYIKIINTLSSTASILWEAFKNSWGQREVKVINTLVSTASSLWTTFKNAWDKGKRELEVKLKITEIVDGVKTWFNKNVIDKLNSYWSKVPILGKYKIPYLAGGGFPDVGQLFIAREAGPELVGTMGGRNVVANNDQITTGIYKAVKQAMTESGNGRNQSGDLYITIKNEDGTSIQRIIRNYNQYMKSTGGEGGFVF